MVSLLGSDWELGALWVHLLFWGVLSVAAIALFLLKRRKDSQGWRWRIAHSARYGTGWLLRKIPWKPLFIWGPWAVILLILGFYGFENWRGARAWEKKKEELADRGEPVTWNDFAPEIRREDNFLLDPWVREATQDTDLPVLLNPDLRWEYRIGGSFDLKTWAGNHFARIFATEEEAQQALEVELMGRQEEMEQVGRALAERSQWPSAWYGEDENTVEFQSVVLGELRVHSWFRSMEARGFLRVGRGDVTSALEDLRRMEELAHFSYLGVPDLRLLQKLSDLIWELLYTAKADPTELAPVAERLARYDCYEFVRRAQMAERVWLFDEIDEAASHRAALKNEWRVPFVDVYADWMPDALEESQAELNHWLLRLAPGGWFEGWKAQSALFYDELVLSGAYWRENLDLLDELRSRGLPDSSVSRLMTFPRSAPIWEQTRMDLTRIAIHLERYRKQEGRYPEQLKALVPALLPEIPTDQGNDERYRYRLLPDGSPMLYGIGLNGIDNDGLSSSDDIWWYFPPHDVAAERHPSAD